MTALESDFAPPQPMFLIIQSKLGGFLTPSLNVDVSETVVKSTGATHDLFFEISVLWHFFLWQQIRVRNETLPVPTCLYANLLVSRFRNDMQSHGDVRDWPPAYLLRKYCNECLT